MMKRYHSVLHGLLLTACITFAFIGAIMTSSWIYTTSQLNAARGAGVFSSAEEGMRARITKGYIEPDDTQIIYAGTNSFDGSSPHVWYGIACVWGGHRSDGSPTGSTRHAWDQPGSFFLDTKRGWVHVSEGAFPLFMGFWMKVYGLAGPGSSQPTHDWGSSPERDCDF